MQSRSIICGKDQYTVTNGSFSYCLNCFTCHSGYGLYPVCGQSVPYPPSNIGCKPCPNQTFSDKLDSAPCYGCQKCVKLEIVAAPCTRISDQICSRTCERGYFFSNVPHISCQQCSYCCFDGKDKQQQECIKQGLNATGRHCSARMDKQCGPHLNSSTAAVTIQTNLAYMTHSTPHPTDDQSVHHFVFKLSLSLGIFFLWLAAVSCLFVIRFYHKRFKKWSRKSSETILLDRSPGN